MITVENKKDMIVNMVVGNPSCLSIFENELDTSDLVDIVKEAIHKALPGYQSILQEVEKIEEATKDLSVETKVALVSELPHLIEYYQGSQTLEMCKAAVDAVYKQDKNNSVHVFMHIEHQDAEMVKKMAEADGRTYKYFKPEFITDEIKEIAVKQDAVTLCNIRPPHSRKLAEMAILQWPKAVRWVKCADLKDQEDMQILAIEKNLQAMPDNPVSEKVINRFKELCVKNNYFDEVWCPKFNLSQDRLYSMLTARRTWIESYKIFSLLDEEHMMKAMKKGAMRYEIKLPVDRLLRIKDNELLALICRQNSKDAVQKLFNILPKSKLTEIVSYEGGLLRYVPAEKRDDEMCIIAFKNNKEASRYISKWTPKLKELILEELR